MWSSPATELPTPWVLRKKTLKSNLHGNSQFFIFCFLKATKFLQLFVSTKKKKKIIWPKLHSIENFLPGNRIQKIAKLYSQQNTVHFLPAPTCSPVFLGDTSKICILSFKLKQCNKMTRNIRELNMPSGGWIYVQLGEQRWVWEEKAALNCFSKCGRIQAGNCQAQI